jgi:hypothetical protein
VKYPNDHIPFRTRAEDARLDAPLVKLPSGWQVTLLPLADGVAEPLPNGAMLRASLVRVDAIEALAAFGLQLCPLEVLHEMASVGIWTPPQTLVSDAYDQSHMQSLGYKQEHDRRCWAELAKQGITPENVASLERPIFNFGKTHKAAEEGGKTVPENGDNFLGGWDKVDDGRPDFIQAGIGRNHRGEAKSLRDYGTNVYGCTR